MIDIVCPQGNESKLIEMAERLGYKELCFLYDAQKDISSFQKKTALKLFSASLYPKRSILTAAKASGDDRPLLERKDIDIIYGLEMSRRPDFMHHRNSGLNQVLCKLASDNKIMLCLDFGSVLKNKGMFRSRILGRMMQNIEFCRKYKIKTAIASFARNPYEMRSPRDLMSFGIVLGMHPKEASDSLDSVHDRLLLNLKKRAGEYFG
jgi:RNase P/RNase MRP subunit p30